MEEEYGKIGMNKENLLDSFAWIDNTGNMPDFEFVEVILENEVHLWGRAACFRWSIYFYREDIAKYREISKEEYLIAIKKHPEHCFADAESCAVVHFNDFGPFLFFYYRFRGTHRREAILNNKHLLDSFAWIDNTGKRPRCDYVVVRFRGNMSSVARVNDFNWAIIKSFDDIIKYREISEEEYEQAMDSPVMFIKTTG